MNYTTHALRRLAERDITRSEVSWTIEYGKKHKPYERDRMIAVCDSIGVVYNPKTKTVVTAWKEK